MRFMNEDQAASPAGPAAPQRASFLRLLGEFLRLAVIAAAIAIPVRYFIAQPFIVRGASMEPNFHDGQYLIIDELSYFFRAPQRGEVVIFRYPLDTSEYFIKRVIGLPGETVEIKEGSVFISSPDHPTPVKLDESYLPAGLSMQGNIRFTLGAHEYVVLGDNRPVSSDSRIWGVLDRKFITGHAVFRAWPLDKVGLLQ